MNASGHLIELGTLAAYLAVLLWIGVRSSRWVKTSADYTLAGRNVPWVIVMATTAATMIGGGASVGMVSRVAEIGIAVAAAGCAWFFRSIADTLEFVYDFWSPTMILPFLVAVFWYRERRIHAVVVSMIVGAISAVVWRFVLGSPGDIGPAS